MSSGSANKITLNLAPIALIGIKSIKKGEGDDTTIIENDDKEFPVHDYGEKINGSKSEERSKIIALKNKF
jgi:hypothetical protein